MPFAKNSFFKTTWVTVITSFLAIAIGSIALLGWVLNIDELKSFNPAWATMKVNTALCIILSSTSLLLISSGRKKPAFVLAALVFLIGALTACEYLFQWDAHIDKLFYRETNVTPAIYPGRMTQVAARGFIAIGLSLLLFYSDKKRWLRVSEALAILVLLISHIAFISYVYNAAQFFKAIQVPVVSLPTVISGLLISYGILFSRPDSGILAVFNKQTIAAKVGLRGIFIAMILIILLGWLRVKSEEINIFDKAMGISIMAIFFAIIFFLATWISTRRLNIAEEKINTSQKMFSTIFYQSPVLNVIADASTGKYIDVNDNFAEFVGLKKEDIIGKNAVELELIVDKNQRQEIIKTIKEKGFIVMTPYCDDKVSSLLLAYLVYQSRLTLILKISNNDLILINLFECVAKLIMIKQPQSRLIEWKA